MRTAAAVVLALLLAGCAGSSSDGDASGEALGGMGVPQQFREEEYPGPRESLTVRVHLARNGCFLGRLQGGGIRRLVVWPTGTEQGDDGDELLLPGGGAVRHGDVVTAQGLLLATDRLPGYRGDGFWAHAVGFCTPDAPDVLVLDLAAIGS